MFAEQRRLQFGLWHFPWQGFILLRHGSMADYLSVDCFERGGQGERSDRVSSSSTRLPFLWASACGFAMPSAICDLADREMIRQPQAVLTAQAMVQRRARPPVPRVGPTNHLWHRRRHRHVFLHLFRRRRLYMGNAHAAIHLLQEYRHVRWRWAEYSFGVIGAHWGCRHGWVVVGRVVDERC